mmetsp:Transcript_4423/g.9569  ORF Transcript_4423/g.9569 Transcript_4423/m.9569 type:complete len:373 (-) Transcript_4423:201-1319(-)|eukprot:CAMPEP_0172531150 /NCGR_PEP_ID=MMETSP1067-20121228/4663_1 /TAXON_ID=265564 ORGANISM="Thalassiosira punctigera, Strain Tpunct2005C2" /NCGR_SAMPLE_ID=MMETSP1067 /ASSEMBLY_ACC=CAM_ASM_000444 /LENGTH=372 /DNA_ID=CAMNT_0013315497 /DNA_START=641 /DNA_END=1759 /DNA_ORIENTATION=+
MSKKAARDPNAPKRNQSAYLLYQNAMRDTFKLQNPGMTFGQLAKYTSAMYAEMPLQEKEAWAQRAEQDKARYLHELSQYVPPPGYDVKGDPIAGHNVSMRALKSGKHTRDPNAPKKNMSAYLMYQNTMRESFRTENPGMTFGQLSKFTSAMYKSLTPEEKARWEEAALQDKARYEAEMANYAPPPGFDPTGQLVDPNIGPVSRKYSKKHKDPNAPKRARGSYVFFTLDERPKIVKETPDMKFTEMGHVMGERWRALSAEDKKKYEDLANDDKKRFNEEMAAYNANKLSAASEPAAAAAPYSHPQYQEAQQYAEQYYAQHDAATAAAAQYDPNAAAYAQYYAQQGYPQGYPPQGQGGYPGAQNDSSSQTYHYA